MMILFWLPNEVYIENLPLTIRHHHPSGQPYLEPLCPLSPEEIREIFVKRYNPKEGDEEGLNGNIAYTSPRATSCGK
jgi:hypothetical protein